MIAPQRIELDCQLKLLLECGLANGAYVEMIWEAEFRKRVLDGRSTSGRALWSPVTCVVNPKAVLQRLEKRLRKRGVSFVLGISLLKVKALGGSLRLALSNIEQKNLSYGYFFNAVGLQADRVARAFGV